MISKELLSEVLGNEAIIKVQPASNTMVAYWDIYSSQHSLINIHELAHKCILYAWYNLYEITPRVMGAEIMCLKTGYEEHIIERKDVENPKEFDPRFIFKACEWVRLHVKDKQ